MKVHALQASVLESTFTTQSMLPGDLLAVLHDMPLVSEHFEWVQCLNCCMSPGHFDAAACIRVTSQGRSQ